MPNFEDVLANSDNRKSRSGPLLMTIATFVLGSLATAWFTFALPFAITRWSVPHYLNPAVIVLLVVAPVVLSLTGALLLSSSAILANGQRSPSFSYVLNVWFLGASATGLTWSVYGFIAGTSSSMMYQYAGAAYMIVALLSVRPVDSRLRSYR
jgi:hypothetical protein